MQDEYFDKHILICKPHISLTFYFNEEELAMQDNLHISQLVNEIKVNNPCVEAMLGDYGMENFTFQTTYIKRKDYLLAFERDKVLDEVFSDFQTENLEFAHFYVAGGASVECDGYRFVIHSNESVHRNMPHVHVIKDDESVRYSLVSLERIDECSRMFLRDEQKRILPALKKHLPRLKEYWIAAMGGYRPPEFDFKNKQYYPES